jgi:hypothetical protein
MRGARLLTQAEPDGGHAPVQRGAKTHGERPWYRSAGHAGLYM